MKFENQTILITDPCYIINDIDGITSDDWAFCNYGSNLEALGLKTFMVSSTGEGDGMWNLYSCDDPTAVIEEFRNSAMKDEDLYDSKASKSLSDMGKEFSADSGQTGVFDLSEVLAYNALFMDDLPDRCYAIIEDFTGDINFEFIETKSGNKFLVVKGEGSVNFITL